MPRPLTLLVVVDPEGNCDLQAAEAAACVALPGIEIERVEVIEEHEIGAWLRNHRAKRCRSVAEVLSVAERWQPVVVDIDLPRAGFS